MSLRLSTNLTIVSNYLTKRSAFTLRVTQLGGRLDEAASNDKKIAGVGVILFWPALFALGGTKAQEAEYARLKGEHDAVQQASISKKCGSTTPAANATPPSTTTSSN